MCNLSLIIPCYNEEGNILPFYEEVEKSFNNSDNKNQKTNNQGTKSRNTKNHSIHLELIFINDGSKDKTAQQLQKLLKISSFPTKIINFSRNFGKEAAIYAGLKNINLTENPHNYIAIIDSDLQQQPKLLLEMIKIIEQNPDYDAVAAYQDNRQDPFLKKHLSNLFYKLINKISNVQFYASASDFRLFRPSVAKAILEVKEYYRFSKGIFAWIGFNTYYLPYTPNQRVHGESKWSLKNLIKYAIDGMMAYSTFPIKVAIFIGCFVSLFSFIYLIITIIQKLCFGIDVPGYASLIGVILFIGGVQLLFLGIIGEYIARTYIETKNRPIYIAKEILTNDKENK